MALCQLEFAKHVSSFDRQYPKKKFPSEEIRIKREAAVAVCYGVIPNDLWGAAASLWAISQTEKEPHSNILRDVFGNVFRPVTLNPTWLTSNVLTLAQEIYDNRSFDRLPSLADVLEEAPGCDNPEILAHCRGPGPHVRGCWALDLVLGKERASRHCVQTLTEAQQTVLRELLEKHRL
jgi:hypothetical protein